MNNYNIENQDFRDLLSVYKKTQEIINAKKEKFYKIATHYGVTLKNGFQQFLDIEEEIAILERNYLTINRFLYTQCDEKERYFLNEIMNGTSLEKVNAELGCSRRTSYRIMARLSKRFFEFIEKEKQNGNKKTTTN